MLATIPGGVSILMETHNSQPSGAFWCRRETNQPSAERVIIITEENNRNQFGAECCPGVGTTLSRELGKTSGGKMQSPEGGGRGWVREWAWLGVEVGVAWREWAWLGGAGRGRWAWLGRGAGLMVQDRLEVGGPSGANCGHCHSLESGGEASQRGAGHPRPRSGHHNAR